MATASAADELERFDIIRYDRFCMVPDCPGDVNSPTQLRDTRLHNSNVKLPRRPIPHFDYDSDSADSDTSDSISSFNSDIPSSHDDISLIDYDGDSMVQFDERRRRRLRRDSMMDEEAPKAVEVPPFPVGERIYFREDCIVCLIESTHPSLHVNQSSMLKPRFRPCCSKFVCSACLEGYCSVKVYEGIVHIGCPNSACKAYLHRDEIAFHLKTDPLKEKFYKFLIDANRDPLTKTCPRCCHVTKAKSSELKSRKKKQGLKKTCPECQLVWCFPCQAPWHENLTCKQYCAGDKLVAEWAKEVHYGSRNAQKCPKCMVYIERTEGCDHMSCGYCQTDFCYRCGGRYRSLRFLGSHHSRYSIFGCKYYLKPNKPAQRIIIRSSVLGGKVLAVSAVVTLGVALLPFALMAGAVIAPIYGGIALNKYLKKRGFKPRRKQRRRRRMNERPPVELLSVTPYLHTRAVIPPCELTSHFESDLDSTQMNEIRADLGDLHLESLMLPMESIERPANSNSAALDTSNEHHRRRRRRRYENSNGRERIRRSSSRNRKRRAKIPSSFDLPEPEIDNADAFGLQSLFAEMEIIDIGKTNHEEDSSSPSQMKKCPSTEKESSLTEVEIHGEAGDVTVYVVSSSNDLLETIDDGMGATEEVDDGIVVGVEDSSSEECKGDHTYSSDDLGLSGSRTSSYSSVEEVERVEVVTIV